MGRYIGCACPLKTNKCGFSIVEILVVIAAIAILAGILFPFLFQMRQAGYQTKCVSNLQQLSAAFCTYSQDWNDYWPCPGGLVGDRSYWHQSGSGGLVKYIKQHGFKSVWCCPVMPEWKSYYPPRSYCMNSYLREPADIEYYNCTSILKGIRFTDIQRLGETILLFEGLPLKVGWETDKDYIYIYRCCNWKGVKGFSDTAYSRYTFDPGRPWHGKLNNYVYADGHIVARPPGRKSTGDLSSHNEMYQWYVDKGKFEKTWNTLWYKCAPYK